EVTALQLQALRSDVRRDLDQDGLEVGLCSPVSVVARQRVLAAAIELRELVGAGAVAVRAQPLLAEVLAGVRLDRRGADDLRAPAGGHVGLERVDAAFQLDDERE